MKFTQATKVNNKNSKICLIFSNVFEIMLCSFDCRGKMQLQKVEAVFEWLYEIINHFQKKQIWIEAYILSVYLLHIS